MRWLTDLAWLLIALTALPLLLPGLLRRGWFKTDLRGRRGLIDMPVSGQKGHPHVLLAAVSVGEVNAIRTLVPQLVERGARVTVAVTTDTGFARASKQFAGMATVTRYPFDLSVWVHRFLDAVSPDVVGLVELEVWPNFMRSCGRREIPVQVIGGRLSDRSFRRYRRASGLVRPMFKALAGVHAQDAAIADRFSALGALPVEVTSSLKWDHVAAATSAADADALAEAMGIDRSRPLVVVGSSAPHEHAMVRDAMPAGCQLLCAPRRPEWWSAAAEDLPGCARRSLGEQGSDTDRFLLDTIGELSTAYTLADIIIIGRSFGALHGSDPLEPVGLGKAVICGPAMGDFGPSMAVLLPTDAIVQVEAASLGSTLATLLKDTAARDALGLRGTAAIRSMQGASEMAADRLLALATC